MRKLGKAFEDLVARAGDPGGGQLICGDLTVSRVSRPAATRRAKSRKAQPVRATGGAGVSKGAKAEKVAAKTARSPARKSSASRRRGSPTG